MTDFDIDGPLEGIWFPYFKSTIDEESGKIVYLEPEDDGEVLIRSIEPFVEKLLKAKKRNRTQIVHNPKQHRMEPVEVPEDVSIEQQIKETEDMYDYAIMDYKNLTNKKNKTVIEVTRENKIKLMNIPVFNRFFDGCQRILKGESELKEKKSQKT